MTKTTTAQPAPADRAAAPPPVRPADQPATHQSRLVRLMLATSALTVAAAAARAHLPGPAQPAPELLPTWVAGVGGLAGALATRWTGQAPPRAARLAMLAGASALLVAKAADGIAFDVVGVVMKTVSAVPASR